MELILLIGIQAAGKSIFYKETFFDSHLRINLDQLKTRFREQELVNACMNTRTKMVIDNTNVSRVERLRYISPAKQSGFKIFGYVFEPDLKSCLERNNERKGKARIPDAGLRNALSRCELPHMDEGFTDLFKVRLVSGNGFLVERLE